MNTSGTVVDFSKTSIYRIPRDQLDRQTAFGHLNYLRQVMEWLETLGQLNLDSSALSFERWDVLSNKAFELFADLGKCPSVNKIFADVVERGIEELLKRLEQFDAEGKLGAWPEDTEYQEIQQWWGMISHQLQPGARLGINSDVIRDDERARRMAEMLIPLAIKLHSTLYLHAIAYMIHCGDERAIAMFMEKYTPLVNPGV